MRHAARVAVFGTGLTGTELVRACLGGRHRLVAGVVTSAQKDGLDLGELTVGEPIGVPVTRDLDAVLARDDVDVLLYAGISGAVLEDVFGRCADAGKDAITASGLVHPPSTLGDEGARRLDARARAGGARLLGTGVNPGFLLDVLPVVIATAMPDPATVWGRRVTDIRAWGPEVLRQEVAFGQPPGGDAGGTFVHYVAESLGLVAAGLGLELDAIETHPDPILAERRATIDGLVAEPGSIVGFHHRADGIVGGEARVTLEWRGTADPAADGTPEGLDLRVSAPGGLDFAVRAEVPRNPYPGTAARMVKSIAPLRALPPGLRRPDELAAVVRDAR
jgi:hypothetical protein